MSLVSIRIRIQGRILTNPMFAKSSVIPQIISALRRSRFSIMTVALTYLISVVVGMAMVHTGNSFALRTRDQVVAHAFSGNNPSINALQNKLPFQAALSDFSSNLFLGAIPSTVAGLGVVFPYPIAAYRGWVGGIVSVDGQHVSRFTHPWEAVYYLVTLILQLIPYSLAGGVGVQLGVAYYHLHSKSPAPSWYVLPQVELIDVARVYLLVVPIFFIASLWEFLFR